MLIRTMLLCALMAMTIHSLAAAEADLETLVKAAQSADVKALDDLKMRVEKNKLTRDEAVSLFGKNTTRMTAKDKLAHLEEMREKLLSGEMSLQKLRPSNLKVGDAGELPPTRTAKGPPSVVVKVEQVVASEGLLCRIWTEGPKGNDWGPAVLFRGLKEQPVDGDWIKPTMPLIVTGRYSYATVGAGTRTVLVLEPLSACVKRVGKTDNP